MKKLLVILLACMLTLSGAYAENGDAELNALIQQAEQGDAISQYNLGVEYYVGGRVEQDYAQAAEWFRRAAEQGDVSGQYWLGYCYEYGLGVSQDYAQMVHWYTKAAEQEGLLEVGSFVQFRARISEDEKTGGKRVSANNLELIGGGSGLPKRKGAKTPQF